MPGWRERRLRSVPGRLVHGDTQRSGHGSCDRHLSTITQCGVLTKTSPGLTPPLQAGLSWGPSWPSFLEVSPALVSPPKPFTHSPWVTPLPPLRAPREALQLPGVHHLLTHFGDSGGHCGVTVAPEPSAEYPFLASPKAALYPCPRAGLGAPSPGEGTPLSLGSCS